MQQVVVANVDSPAMCGAGRQGEDYAHSAMSADRLLTLARDGDLVVLPRLPSEEFVHYQNELLGRSLSLKDVVVPPGAEEEGLIWSHRALTDDRLAEQVAERAGGTSGWGLQAYFFDRPVMALADRLGLDLDPRVARYLRAGGAETFNSKVAFRQVAEVAGLPVAEGHVVSSAGELAAALDALLGVTGRVIVKQDLNLGGAGNTIVTTHGERELTGARVVHQLGPGARGAELAERIWPTIAVDRNTSAVVEVYHLAEMVLYSEVLVPGLAGAPKLLNFGEMRMEPVFCGFEIPSQRTSDILVAEMAAYSVDIARAAGERGFTGYMNIDSIVTEAGDLMFTEINGRMGACTHIDVLARHLLGDGYLRQHVLLTRNRVPVPGFGRALVALRSAGLAYDHDRGSGVVVAAEGVRATGTLEYVAIGQGIDEARDLEARTVALLQDLPA